LDQKRFVRELLRYIMRNDSLWKPKDYDNNRESWDRRI
jgi:hypothetical protein